MLTSLGFAWHWQRASQQNKTLNGSQVVEMRV
jgi:hypothetical protein